MSTPTIVGVYRARNAGLVERLVAPALARGWRTAWWALDEVAPSLEAYTAGIGPGTKPVLLNRLVASLGVANAPVLLSDDDIRFVRGDVVELADLCERAGLGLAQPAHGPGSHVSHDITRVAARSHVRETTFVESGPLLVVMPEWALHVLPLPEDRGMGWGLEFDWIDLHDRGCRLGIVDGTPVTHLAKVGEGYDDTEERARVRAHLDVRGIADWRPLQRTLGTWRSWQRTPPWLASSRASNAGDRADATDSDGATVIVDHWYSPATGHVIEALRRCQAYHAADPSARISLVLNGASPGQIARCVPFVETVFGVRYSTFGAPSGDPSVGLRQLPRDWDYVLHHPAGSDESHQRYGGLRRYYTASAGHFRAREHVGVIGEEPPGYIPHQHLRLALPEDARASAVASLAGRRGIAVMLSGSSDLRALYPSAASWIRILNEVRNRLPDTVFVFVGRHQAGDGGTVSGIPRSEALRIKETWPDALDVFDRPILEQLAAVEACTLFLSPHTGFGFAAVAVDTPWLTLSGGDWHEYFFNGVPFYSVLPKSTDVPAFVHSRKLPMIDADEDGEGSRTATMSVARIREDLDELVTAAEALVEGRLGYEAALAGYFPRLLEAYRGDLSAVHTFEDLHRRFL